MKHIHVITFSPTGTTRTVAEFLADRIGARLNLPVVRDDLTLPENRSCERLYGADELLVAGVPVYAGRVPNKIAPELERLLRSSGNTPAIAAVTFGNRSAGSALRELRNILQKNDFCVFAAGAFAAPHAFADIGKEHPTGEDRRKAEILADAAAGQLLAGTEPVPVVIDGDRPVEPYYVPKGEDGRAVNFLKAKPKTDLRRCTRCGICAEVCPMGSIPRLQPEVTEGICIKCQACIQRCPQQAKYLDDPGFLSHRRMLEMQYQKTASSIIYIPETDRSDRR